MNNPIPDETQPLPLSLARCVDEVCCRFEAAWKALERIQPEKWITHRFPIDDGAEAYRLLDESPQEAIQVLLTY